MLNVVLLCHTVILNLILSHHQIMLENLRLRLIRDY